MTTLTRQTTIGRDGRFATIEAATEHYAQYNMRLVSQTSDCAEFGAVVVETQAVSRYGRPINYGEAKYSRPSAFAAGKPAAKPRTQLETAPSPANHGREYHRAEVCTECGAKRDPDTKMARCRSCYNRYYRQRYHEREGYGAKIRERALRRYHEKKGAA